MGKSRKLQNLIGKIKDKASQGGAAVVHIVNPTKQSLHLAILKSTTHNSQKPPDDKYVAALLSSCSSRRTTAAVAVAVWRLRATRDACVAAKCLIVLHRLIRQGDGYRGEVYANDHHQFYAEGRNNLNLNDFRDNSSHTTLELSPWVRWYAQYLDCLSSTSRVLGYFPNITASSEEKAMEKQRLSSYKTGYILRQTDTLVSFFEHIGLRPGSPQLYRNKIVDEIRELVGQDYFPVMRLVMARLEVLNERLIRPDVDCSSSGELGRVLVRLEDCKERLIRFSHRYKVLVEDFWDTVRELKCKVSADDKMLVSYKIDELDKWAGTVEPVWETFDDPVQLNGEPVRFSFGKALRYEQVSI